MAASAHRWSIELLHPTEPIREGFALDADRFDWEPALESTRWAAVRAGDCTPEEAWSAPASVVPIASGRLAEPYAVGFEVRLATRAESPFSRAFSLRYFKGLAEECAAEWVRVGRLATGDRFRYLLTAFRCDERLAPVLGRTVTVRALAPAITIEDAQAGPTPDLALEPAGEGEPDDPPIVVPAAILTEAAEHVLATPDKETGGFLLGKLVRTAPGEIAASVTAYLPAHAEGTATRLAFTPECWTAARAAIALRGSRETLVGWIHSHIVDALCKDCDQEKRRVCPLASGFFSEHDRTLHRVAFPRAYQFALVANLNAGAISHSCFGWRDGAIAGRAFHVGKSREEALTCREHV